MFGKGSIFWDGRSIWLWLRLFRLNLAEKLKAPWTRGGKRPDPALAAAREAARLEQEQGGGPLGFTVKMMLIGLTGVCEPPGEEYEEGA